MPAGQARMIHSSYARRGAREFRWALEDLDDARLREAGSNARCTVSWVNQKSQEGHHLGGAQTEEEDAAGSGPARSAAPEKRREGDAGELAVVVAAGVGAGEDRLEAEGMPC